MSDIKQFEDHKTFWKRSTMEIITFTEGSLADIIQLARKDILSLLTTIESLQKEKDEQHDTFYNEVRFAYQQIESQEKEIRALKEESLKQMEFHMHNINIQKREIESLKTAAGHLSTE